jgi:tyrosyl-tRNA synthetase
VLFGGNIDSTLRSSDFEAIFKGSGCIVELPRDSVVGQNIVSVAGSAKLVASKGELKRIFDQGGFYLNNKQETNQQRKIEESDIIDSKILLLRTGKKNYKLIKLT